MSELISRQAAIDYFVTNVGFNDEDGYPIEDECELRKIWTDIIEGIPPAPGVISGQEAIDAIMGQPPELHYPSWYAQIIKDLMAKDGKG